MRESTERHSLADQELRVFDLLAQKVELSQQLAESEQRLQQAQAERDRQRELARARQRRWRERHSAQARQQNAAYQRAWRACQREQGS